MNLRAALLAIATLVGGASAFAQSPEVRLVAAAGAADPAGVAAALAQGADPNAYVGLDTALTATVRRGGSGSAARRRAIVRRLLAAGADPSRPLGGAAAAALSTAQARRARGVWQEQSCARCHRPGRPIPGLRGILERGRLRSGPASLAAFRAALADPAHPWEEVEPADQDLLWAWLLRRDSVLAGKSALQITEYRCQAALLDALPAAFEPSPTALEHAPRSYFEVRDLLFDLRREICRYETIGGEGMGRPFEAIDVLLSQWEQNPGNDTPAPYADDLALIYRGLRASVDNGARKIAPDSPLQYAFTDLARKADDCLRHPSGMGRLVPVEVSVVRAGQPLHGWRGFYISKVRLFDPSSRPQPLPNLSSPASGRLPPGNYLIHAVEQTAGAATEPVELAVGGGVDAVTLDLVAR